MKTKNEPISIVELQSEIFKIPKYQRYISLGGSQFSGKKKVLIYNCRDPNGLQIPFDFLIDFKPILKRNTSLEINIISDDMDLSNYQLNKVLNKYIKENLLKINIIPVDKYERDQQERVKEYREKMKALGSGFSKGEIKDRINQLLKKKRRYDSREISLDKQVKILLQDGTDYRGKLLETEDLDIGFTQNAPKGWPQDTDIPKEVLSIIGEEYSKNILSDGINHNEDLYSEKEIKIKIGNGRAWPIPSLMGNLIFFRSYQDIHNVLESYVQNNTGLPFVFSKGGGYGGVGVYKHLHAYAGLGLREQKPNTVYLELYGSLLAANGYSFTQFEYEEYLLRKYNEEGKLFIPEGPLVVQILQATLSNYSYPGIGIPFYL